MSKQRWRMFYKKFVLGRLFLLALLVSLAIAVVLPALTEISASKSRQELVQQIKANTK